MLEAKTPNRRRVVISDPLLLGVEPHALADDLLGLAGCAPDGEGAFEAHGQDAFRLQFARAPPERVPFARGRVGGAEPFEIRRDVAAHVEALHFGGGCGWMIGVEYGCGGFFDEASSCVLRCIASTSHQPLFLGTQ